MSLEKQVTENTPPAFIWHTFTDNVVPSENSMLFAMALKEKGVNCELHIFPTGDMGWRLPMSSPKTRADMAFSVSVLCG